MAAISFSLVTPFLPLFIREELNVSTHVELWSGIAVSASFVASALLSPVWGALADKYGRKIMIIRSGLGIGLTYISSAFVHNLFLFIFLRTMQGVLSGFIPSSTALVATNTPEERISRSLGILQTGIAAGTIMGPLFGGVLAYWFGIRETIFIGGFTILIGTGLVLFGVKETAPRSKEKANVIRDLKVGFTNPDLFSVLMILFAVQVSLSLIQPVLTLYIEDITPMGMDVSLVTGVVFSMVGLATILAAPKWTDIGDRIGCRTVLMIGLFAGAVFNVTQLFFPNVYLFGAWRFFFGLSIAGVIPAINSMIARSVTPDFRGRAFGISTSFNQIGQATGPLAGGAIAGVMGLRAPFVVASIACIVAVFFMRQMDRHRMMQ